MTPADVLARTIWAEARSEGTIGMEAVASVIMNRARHPRWWGIDVVGVCTHPWQFTCWQPEPVGQLARLRAVTAATDKLFAAAQSIAAQAIAGTLVDQTEGADSYANLDLCTPAWSRNIAPCAKIGHHTFWRLELLPPSRVTA